MYKSWMAVVESEFGKSEKTLNTAADILNVFDDENDGAVPGYNVHTED